MDRLRLSSIFAIFLLIAPRLIGGKTAKTQLWRAAAGYSRLIEISISMLALI